jgi:hypothetical protein
MHDRIGMRRHESRPHGASRTHDFRKRRNAEHRCEAKDIEDAMAMPIGCIGAAEGKTLQGSGRPVSFDRPDALPPGDPGQECRPVAGLRRHREIVAPGEPQQQRDAFARARPLWHNNDAGKIRIARKNAFRPGEYQRLDRGGGKRPLDAANERRRQQDVAEPAQYDDEHAWMGRQPERFHGFAMRRAGGAQSRSRSTMPPATPTPNT